MRKQRDEASRCVSVTSIELTSNVRGKKGRNERRRSERKKERTKLSSGGVVDTER